jgi:hypothetical protein
MSSETKATQLEGSGGAEPVARAEVSARAEPDGRFIRRLRLAGLLVAAGLVVQVLTLFEAHPFTFFAFLIGGVGLVVAGVLAFVWAWLAQ